MVRAFPAGVTVNHDVLLMGNNVLIDGIVNGQRLHPGQSSPHQRGPVNGSLVMLAQNAAVGGEVTRRRSALPPLTLVDSKTTGAGISILTYRPARDVAGAHVAAHLIPPGGIP